MRHSIVDRDPDDYYLALIEAASDPWANYPRFGRCVGASVWDDSESLMAGLVESMTRDPIPSGRITGSRTPKHRAQSVHEMKEAEEKGPGYSRTPTPMKGSITNV